MEAAASAWQIHESSAHPTATSTSTLTAQQGFVQNDDLTERKTQPRAVAALRAMRR
jgi:hypothetical protein